ncbi:MAG: hypothetical protein ACK6DS_06550 [Planctomycetota bacterium]
MNPLTSGNWTGFYLEPHNPQRGWMHLYLEFAENGAIAGEGTDYVGPWQASGTFEADSGRVEWTKLYLGKHKVRYQGVLTDQGIIGDWTISNWLAGKFHIWPVQRGDIQAAYLAEDLPKR